MVSRPAILVSGESMSKAKAPKKQVDVEVRMPVEYTPFLRREINATLLEGGYVPSYVPAFL